MIVFFANVFSSYAWFMTIHQIFTYYKFTETFKFFFWNQILAIGSKISHKTGLTRNFHQQKMSISKPTQKVEK